MRAREQAEQQIKDLEAKSRQAEEDFWKADDVAIGGSASREDARTPESEFLTSYDARARARSNPSNALSTLANVARSAAGQGRG
jgi:hypothetical protein